MAKLSLSLFKLILFYEYMIDLKNESYIIHLENYELYRACRHTRRGDNKLSSLSETKYR